MIYFGIGLFLGAGLGFILCAWLSKGFHPRDLEDYEDEEFARAIKEENG